MGNEKGYTILELMVLMVTIVVLSVMIYGGYVAHHFITKYW